MRHLSTRCRRCALQANNMYGINLLAFDPQTDMLITGGASRVAPAGVGLVRGGHAR